MINEKNICFIHILEYMDSISYLSQIDNTIKGFNFKKSLKQRMRNMLHFKFNRNSFIWRKYD